MKLGELMRGVALAGDGIDLELEISGICCDTRAMTPGTLFVALSGYKTDGHRFLKQAVEQGAAAVLCERTEGELDCPVLFTEDTRAALATVAANWFGHPAKQLCMIGVTGTNGKTTTTCLIKTMLEQAAGAKVGLIGTNRNLIGKLELSAARTTPDAYELQALLRVMADAGCTHVVMEVSSHALALHRTDGILFDVGVFTNLTQDHLDFHKTMEAYRDAKGVLFKQSRLAALNLDDEAGRWYRERKDCPCFLYSENKDEADLTAKNIRLFPGGAAGGIVPHPPTHSRRVHHLQRFGRHLLRRFAGNTASENRRSASVCGGSEGAHRGGTHPHGLYRSHRLCPYPQRLGEHSCDSP